MLKAVVLAVIACVSIQQQLQTGHDSQKNLTTVRLPSQSLSGQKDRYHSLSFSVYYEYPGKTPTPPERVNFELRSVVKARRLNTDLYVVFVVDGTPVHFGSNRSAIRNPVPGQSWIGEKMVFPMTRAEFLKIAAAKTLAIKLGAVTFEFSDEMLAKVRAVADGIKD
ncbi:MAG: hypothetical protein LC794_13090 [Acidobacteria bacterium]|nr:hypothetical protein [Acidobacteriota bacterium]MCA1627606.1 hypothetical protein [Acidobacteriota bacterium]